MRFVRVLVCTIASAWLIAGCGSAHPLASPPASAATANAAAPPNHPTAATSAPAASKPKPKPPADPTLSLGTTSPAVLRLQQLLAVTHYLPLRWQPADAASAPAPNSLAALARPPAGHWTWAYPDVPSGLRSFWDPGTYTVLTEGAVMAFEHDHGLAVDGIAGPHVWRALLQAAARHQVDTAGYSYVSIRESSPEMLSLWSNGKIVLTSETNTGIAASPTAIGTWPVYARFVSQDMKGTDPNGQPYNDPNVPYVNYFHGGDAIHGFVRASYGYPQSLGCAELPVPAAAKAWHYIQYGTLVTVET